MLIYKIEVWQLLFQRISGSYVVAMLLPDGIDHIDVVLMELLIPSFRFLLLVISFENLSWLNCRDKQDLKYSSYLLFNTSTALFWCCWVNAGIACIKQYNVMIPTINSKSVKIIRNKFAFLLLASPFVAG